MRKASLARGSELTAIVLAAGASRRLGSPKQLVRAGTEPLIVRAVRLARAVTRARVVAVLGAGAPRIRMCLRRHGLAVRVCYNPHWRSGMASSIRAGLSRVPRRSAGALILLVDQARLESRELQRLVARWRRRPGQPAAAVYRNMIGAPAILPRRLFRSLSSIEGDQGARQLLRDRSGITRVVTESAAFDLDTPADAAALASR